MPLLPPMNRGMGRGAGRGAGAGRGRGMRKAIAANELIDDNPNSAFANRLNYMQRRMFDDDLLNEPYGYADEMDDMMMIPDDDMISAFSARGIIPGRGMMQGRGRGRAMMQNQMPYGQDPQSIAEMIQLLQQNQR